MLGLAAPQGAARADDAQPAAAAPTIPKPPVKAPLKIKKAKAKVTLPPPRPALTAARQPMPGATPVTAKSEVAKPVAAKPADATPSAPGVAAQATAFPAPQPTAAPAPVLAYLSEIHPVIPLPPARPRIIVQADSPDEDPIQTGSIPIDPAKTATQPEPTNSNLAIGNDISKLISFHAARYKVPESLLRRVVARESGYNPKARNGPYMGLMQMRVETARGMGYQGGASGLLDADTNLTYGAAYLANAWRISGGNADRAVSLYAGGYYYEAKRKGMLSKLIKGAPAR